ncbi:hypothetical protein SDC9_187216 [bioreactor metagenome]|uniref:Uncharacterized protein n=1 Tax=bioreactor metagenome TaxID=1076179 RepID=A0A645HL27_9ZZZZ
MSPDELADAFRLLETDKLTSPLLEACTSAFSAMRFVAWIVPDDDARRFAFFAFPEITTSPEELTPDFRFTAQIFPEKVPELETSMDISLASRSPFTVPELET